MTKIDRDKLSVAAEFAVASELGRRNIYAQPTYGDQKRTDLLIFGTAGTPLLIEVKGKQSRQWPNCLGIPNSRWILVLVDFAGKSETERPDFYILTAQDWLDFVRAEIKRHRKGGRTVELGPDQVPVWPDQVKNGKVYRGMGVEVRHVSQLRECWWKVVDALK